MNLQPLFDRLLMRWQIAELRVTPKYVKALHKDPRTALTAEQVEQVRSVAREKAFEELRLLDNELHETT